MLVNVIAKTAIIREASAISVVVGIDQREPEVAFRIVKDKDAVIIVVVLTQDFFRKVILPLSLSGVISGVTMVFVPSVSTFVISKLLGGGTDTLLGDLIEMQFLGAAYNPHLGSAISLIMMAIVVVCMSIMNKFGEGEETAVVM